MTHTAEILSVGTEILLGNIANTDAQDVSAALAEIGINVRYHSVVGDNPERVKEAVAIARSRADIIITTGGLGPTYDDLTKQTLAEAFGKKLVFHEPSASRIRDFYYNKIKTAAITENALQQAWMPEGCTIFENDWGTAPGCAFEADGAHVIMLPGPPSECIPMLKACAVPYLRQLSDAVLVSHSVRIFGLGESLCEAMLHDLMVRSENPTLAPYAKEAEVTLRATARAVDEQQAEAMLAPMLAEVQQTIGDYIYGTDIGSLEQAVMNLLKQQRKTVSTAESCTGGLIAKRLTDLPGSSEIFWGSAVTYTNEIKHKVLGVSETLLAEKGAVCAEVAAAMAEGARKLFGTDYALSTTGIAGPGSDERGNPVGLVYMALADEQETYVCELHCGDVRSRCRIMASSYALDALRRRLSGLKQIFEPAE